MWDREFRVSNNVPGTAANRGVMIWDGRSTPYRRTDVYSKSKQGFFATTCADPETETETQIRLRPGNLRVAKGYLP